MDLSKAGEILDQNRNSAAAVRLLSRWAATTGADRLPADVQAVRCNDHFTSNGRQVGHETLVVAGDGRFRVDYTMSEAVDRAGAAAGTGAFGFDGKRIWRGPPSGAAEPWPLRDAVDNPLFVQALAVSAVLKPDSLTRHGTVTIDGGDRLGERRAYRLRLGAAENAILYFWLGLEVADDLQKHDLLEAGADIDPVGRQRHVVFSEWRSVGSVKLPWRRNVVKDRSTEADLEIVTQTCEPLKSADNVLASPKNATPAR